LLSFLAIAFSANSRAAEVLPPPPANHFNDYARAVAPETARRLNAQLDQFERETSNQIVVAIFPTMQSKSSIEEYTVRVAQSWGVGQKDRKNGAVLFIFKNDRTLYIQTGYGLEGALPDARCKQIIENEIVPRFRAGDFDGGVTAGVNAILASIRGEYQGTGQTVADRRTGGGSRGGGSWVFGLIFAFIIFQSIFGRRRSALYSGGGRRGLWTFPGGGNGWGGGNWGGGSGGSSGGGTFSGGGGSFGGGGAGGRW
jgi:uncharacterized protein